MTPALRLAAQRKISHQVHSYDHDKSTNSYGIEAAEQLGIDAARVFKTLIIELDNGSLACAVVPVSGTLNMKRAAKALNAKKASMAEQQKAERSSGYVLGGISPLAQKKALPTVIDSSACEQESMFVSAGKRGLEIELSPQDLATLTNAIFFDIKDC